MKGGGEVLVAEMMVSQESEWRRKVEGVLLSKFFCCFSACTRRERKLKKEKFQQKLGNRMSSIARVFAIPDASDDLRRSPSPTTPWN